MYELIHWDCAKYGHGEVVVYACTGKQSTVQASAFTSYFPTKNVTCPDCRETELFKKACLDVELKFDGNVEHWHDSWWNPETPENIIGVAILRKGRIFSLLSPARHHDVIRSLGGSREGDLQGFLTSQGVFLTRKEACRLARNANQIAEVKKTNPQDTLFSEDLW